jgi:hypothetical protein
MARFFRDLGWPETPGSDEHHRTFECTNGCVIGLYAAKHYEPHFGPRAEGFRAGSCSRSTSRLRRGAGGYEVLRGVEGAELFEEPTEAFWGGGFSWRDPEGNDWDVVWAREATIDERGGVTFP